MSKLGDWHRRFWQFVQFSMYAFAYAVLVDVFRHTDSDIFNQLSVEAVAAPMLALAASFLGLASTAASKAELNSRIPGCILWCIAVTSAYLWFASLVITEENVDHLLIVAALLYAYIPSAFIGLLLAIGLAVLEAKQNFREFRTLAQPTH
ncbi:MAG: hypothetical protein F4180_00445 [Chloroflexi bacterium]|nr:hypothetical protein [Chloroflexota bacterium]